MSNWQLPETFIAQYRAACKLAAIDDKAFANFRNDPHIACVIENTTKEWSDKALEKMGYTPTMVRYWYIWHLIETNLPGWNDWIEYNRSHIIEIGGGYGGQAEVISRITNGHYTIIDLPEVVELQKKYLLSRSIADVKFSIDTQTILYPDQSTKRYPNLCISWCAWSELSRELREEYAEKVISKCDHLFICSNYNKQEDLEILSKYFTGIKEYSDELVQNVIYV